MSREAMKQALDYRTRYDRGCYKCGSHYCPADCPDPTHLVPQQPLCTSPPKTEQEPVAWRYKYPDGFWRFSNGEQVNGSDPIKSQALYTAPPKAAEWVGLTDDVVFELADTNLYDGGKNYGVLAFAKAIEQALKEKNHG